MIRYFFGILGGLCLSYSSASMLFKGEEGFFKGVQLPPWTAWVTFPAGIILIVLCILGLVRGKPKPKTVTAEELAQAKANLEAMYRREHGEAPKYPEEESEK